MKAALFAAALVGCSSAAAQLQTVELTSEQQKSFDPIGSCEHQGRAVDLHQVLFSEGTSLDVETPNGIETISVEGESLYIDVPNGSADFGRHFIDVDSEVSPDEDLDLQLKLAALNGRILLYWRETYQNRIFRQGLFSINGTRLEPLCSGRGGRHTEP